MMYWFWAVQSHIWEHYPAHSKFRILEVGVFEAGNTFQLLETYPKAEVVSVDPNQPSRLERLQKDYGERFTFYQGTSLDYLGQCEDGFDVVLIDGDHNRYTVYNELKLLFEGQEQFPLVLLHDIHKPYGRKDFSYNPNTIPDGELNQDRGGVLSGVEDFIDEYTIEADWDSLRMFKLTLYRYGPGVGVLELLDTEGKP